MLRFKIEAENANVTCSFNGPRGLQSLESSILDLTLAGADTTTVTLEWAMLFACLHPAAQSRLQNEIESVVGWEELPALSHRQQMPFTEAFIQEVLRIGDPVPIGFPHSVTDDMWAGRWFLPAGTTVYLNQYHILRDPATFQAPNEFRPERFLDESGRFDREEARKVVVFSVGKNTCIKLCYVNVIASYHFRQARLPWPERGLKSSFPLLDGHPAAFSRRSGRSEASA